MAGTVIHIGENSSEHLAYKLTEITADVEDKVLHRGGDRRDKMADRKRILDTYTACIRTVRNASSRGLADLQKSMDSP
jgi:hypothetical protein